MSRAIIAGRAYPLGLDNVDTDLIIAAEHLKTLSRLGLGAHAFAALRHQNGNIFTDPRYAGAKILVAGQNFGCGSSREHAVWALKDLGIEAVIAGGYSDIFAGNALKNGLAAISLGPACLQFILAHAMRGAITIDLERQVIGLCDDQVPFAMEESQRGRLLAGGDEIAMTLGFEPNIAEYEARHPAQTVRRCDIPPKKCEFGQVSATSVWLRSNCPSERG
jgi:3-isopropylmalate/(R)-2-methylmalate dehydratase small subunit